MKKMLGLLASLSLFTTSSSVVVACSTPERVSSLKLNQDLAKQVISKITGQDIASIDFGNIFSSGDISSVLTNIINDAIAKQFDYESTNNTLEKLALKQFAASTSEGLPAEFSDNYFEKSATIAEDLLFTQYTSSISSGTRLDLTQLTSLYSLNPIADTTVKGLDGNDIEVKKEDKITINDKTWAIFSEDKAGVLPDLTNLTDINSPFKVNGKAISAKTALRLRFQDYFNNKLMNDIASNLLTMAYNDSTSFLVSPASDGKNLPFINTGSTLFSKTQDWFTTNTTGVNREWKTNVKMVWSFKFDKTDGLTVSAVNKAVAANSDLNPDTGELASGKSLIDLLKDFEQYNTYTADGSNAYDSFFTMQGFKGFTLYENGTSLGTSPISGKNYETKVKEANKAGILMNSGTAVFDDVDNQNIGEIVFVLPVYLMELLGGSDTTSDNVYTIDGADGKGVEIQFGPSDANKDRYKTIWNQKNNVAMHSKDIQGLDKSERIAMINQLKYLVSNDSSTSELAKTTLYSRYLDVDDILYLNLYNELGKYIKTDEDEDN
ncbi:hypothetical protein SCHIN_v1c09490 [Spiroplasma chinense]|uniref:Lipoprotein n=1 Tax=Spiroplasma chinense TaxID=216932 RepID=A0A5B9Y7S3_9MOLU|nr:hypothetical protein [Spiroplasma chinense]QEH62142.1 hypothetical protein SCHIN_v1c09490 [Spiroplasma chinense]